MTYPSGQWLSFRLTQPTSDGNFDHHQLQEQHAEVLRTATQLWGPDSDNPSDVYFLMDNSVIHTRFADDAVRMAEMNMHPGGAAEASMHPANWAASEDGKQHLQFRSGDVVRFDARARLLKLDEDGNRMLEQDDDGKPKMVIDKDTKQKRITTKRGGQGGRT